MEKKKKKREVCGMEQTESGEIGRESGNGWGQVRGGIYHRGHRERSTEVTEKATEKKKINAEVTEDRRGNGELEASGRCRGRNRR